MGAELSPLPGIDRDRLELLCQSRKLTVRQTTFVLAYLLETGRNAPRAYRKAYTVTGSATARWVMTEANRLLSKPAIKQLIHEIEDVVEPAVIEKAIEISGITKARVILKLWQIADANLDDFTRLTADGDRIIDMSGTTRDQLAALESIQVEDFTDGRGDDAREVRRTKIKLHSRVRALELIGRELGMFQKTSTVRHEKVTPEQQAERQKARERAFRLLDDLARGRVIDVQADPAPPAKPNGHGNGHGGNGTTNGSGQ